MVSGLVSQGAYSGDYYSRLKAQRNGEDSIQRRAGEWGGQHSEACRGMGRTAFRSRCAGEWGGQHSEACRGMGRTAFRSRCAGEWGGQHSEVTCLLSLAPVPTLAPECCPPPFPSAQCCPPPFPCTHTRPRILSSPFVPLHPALAPMLSSPLPCTHAPSPLNSVLPVP